MPRPKMWVAVAALIGMLAPQTADPALRAFQLPVERADFADLAARLAVLDGKAEAEDAVAGDQLLHFTGIGEHDADVEAVAVLAGFERFQCLGEVAAGVEGEDVDLGAARRDGVENGLILDAEAGREGYAARHRAGDLDEALF